MSKGDESNRIVNTPNNVKTRLGPPRKRLYPTTTTTPAKEATGSISKKPEELHKLTDLLDLISRGASTSSEKAKLTYLGNEYTLDL